MRSIDNFYGRIGLVLHSLKKRLYFVVASYFAFWARFVLRRWKPRIVVITGSSGKTTLLQLVEAQLGDKAIYSHHANSSIGLPFHILGLSPNILDRKQWLSHFLLAPIKAWRKVPATKLYIVEADTDRPHEGYFLARFLRPEVTLWISVYRTHSMNFDALVHSGHFKTHEQAIAYDFGNFAANTSKLVIANADQSDLTAQLTRVPENAKVIRVSSKAVSKHKIEETQTVYIVGGETIHLPGLHPKELGVSLQMVNKLLDYLGYSPDSEYKALAMPPGRSSVFAGKHDTTIIDSTYNTGLGAMKALLELFNDYPANKKWLIIGDILEQGSLEAEEHEKLAEAIARVKAERVILLGTRTRKHTYPLLKKQLSIPIDSFESPKEVLDFIEKNMRGGETLFFKGGRFLEGVIEQLLADPADAKYLVRREPVWTKRRQQWGLPR